MKTTNYDKNLFIIASLWNFGAAIPSWIGMLLIPDILFPYFGMPIATSLFPFNAMFSLIIVFGIGYLMVSENVTQNHAIIFTGMIGKVLFFCNCLIALFIQQGNLLLIFTGVVDLIFAVLFLQFLRKNKYAFIKRTEKTVAIKS